MKNAKNVHVVPNGKKWSAKVEGAQKATKTFETQKDTIIKARDMAIKNESELFIHGKDGKIREKNSYGNDPKNVRG
jgi:cytochrome oxidase Cu insertion factor (SCO1/SenC/PrrC family)